MHSKQKNKNSPALLADPYGFPGLAVFFHNPVPTLAYDLQNRRLLLCNPALQRLSGLSPSTGLSLDICLHRLTELFPGPHNEVIPFLSTALLKDGLRIPLSGTIASGRVENVTLSLWDPEEANDPTLFPPFCRIAQFLVPETRPAGLPAPAQQPLRNASESTLAQYQLWLDLALDSVNNGLWAMKFIPGESHYRSLVFTSPNALRMLGYSPEDMPADNPLTWDKLTHPDDFPETLRCMREHIFEAKTDHYEAEFRVKTKDGRWQWLRSYGRVTRRDEHGNPLEAMGTHIDIDRIKKTEENLQKSEFRFRVLVDNMPLGLMLVDKTGAIDYLNPQFNTLFGYDPNTLTTLDIWLNSAYQDNGGRVKAAQFIPTPEQKSYMSAITCADGSIKFTRTYLVELPLDRRLFAYEDVTAQISSEAALLTREQELQEKSQTLEEVNIALRVVLNQKKSEQNELKSTMYISLRDLVLPYLDELEAQMQTRPQNECLSTIRHNLRHMTQLCRTELSLSDINLTRREKELVELIRADMTTKRIAAKLGLSERAVDFHRNNLRKKLGIAQKPVNLKTYLKAMPRSKPASREDA